MQPRRALSAVGLVLTILYVHEPAYALRAKNSTEKAEQTQKRTGLLCREPRSEHGSNDLDVVLEEGGRRSLVFSRSVKDKDGKEMGREVAGQQSTVHCADSHDQQCFPADLGKEVPTCTEVGQSGKCSCTTVVSEPLKLAYQQKMVSEALALCQAKAPTKEPFRVLMLGLGGGAMPMYIRHRCESALVESVELDSRVALIAQRLFGFRPDSSNRVEIADGEEAVERIAKTHPWPKGPHFDVVLVDCFDGESHVAPSCRSERFIHAVRTVLTNGGHVFHNVMDTDMKQLLPMYQATFGAPATTKEAVKNGQFLIVATTHENHPRHDLDSSKSAEHTNH